MTEFGEGFIRLVMDIVTVGLGRFLIWGKGGEIFISMEGSCILLGGSLNVWRRTQMEAE